MTPSPASPFADRLAAMVCRWPVQIILLSLAAAIVCGLLTAQRLEFQSNRNDLLGDDISWNRRFVDWLDSFPGANDLIIVIESDPTDRAVRDAARSMVRDLVTRLEAEPRLGDVEWGAARTEFTPKAARLAPLQRFAVWAEEAIQARSLLEHDTPGDVLREVNRRMLRRALFGGEEPDPEQMAEDLDGLTRLVHAIHRGFEDASQVDAAFDELVEDPDDEQWIYLESPNGRLLFVQVSPLAAERSVNASAAAIAATRRIIGEVRLDHPGIEVGLTGVEVVDSDETAVATVDSTIASIIAVILIAGLLIAAFQSVRLPLILIGSLLIGVAWSFGFLVLAIGHLQVLSVVFVVVLLGLGVDFGIHLIATFEQRRMDYPDGRDHFQPALAASLRLCGPGIVAGALTTSAAFLTTAFTDFRGVAEMGIIASGGIVLCLLSTFTVLPAMMRLFRHSHRHVRAVQSRVQFFRESWILPISRHPVITLLIALVIVGVGAWGATKVRFVYDLIALQPRGVESIVWQHKLITDGDVSIYFGVSVVDSLDEARARDVEFAAQPHVASVGGIGIIFPDQEEAKLALTRAARGELETAFEHAATTPKERSAERSTTQLTTALATLDRRLAAAEKKDVPEPVAGSMRRLRAQLHPTVELFRTIELRERIERVAAMDAAYLDMRRKLAASLDAFLDPEPLGPEDLPASIMRPYVDDSDPDHPRYCLHVYPKLPEELGVDNPLAPEFLPLFVEDLTDVDPLVTGSVMQIHYSADLILSSYLWAGGVALGLVFLFVLLNFESIYDACLAMLPVVLSFTLAFAVMAWADVSLNPANLMVLPLMFGIGIDAGIHVLHRARMNPAERPVGLTRGTGKGVTLTCLTTMIGFASMMVARHHGVSSLGFVLTVGIGIVTLVCWTILPAWLELRQRRFERRAARSGGGE